jgi:hypothetical protein
LNQILKWVSKSEVDPEKMAADRERRSQEVDKRSAAATTAQGAAARAQTAASGVGADPALIAKAKTTKTEAERLSGLAGGAEAVEKLGSRPVSHSTFIKALKEGSHGAGGGLTGSVAINVLGDQLEELDKITQAYIAVLTGKEKDRHQSILQKYGLTVDSSPGAVHGILVQESDKVKAKASELTGSPVSLGFDLNGTKPSTVTVNDAFISKDGSMYRGPSADNILMFKDGGPLDPRNGGGGGGVVININGGDQAMVYRTVARAMRAAQA